MKEFERLKAICEKEGFDWEYAPKSLTGLELGILITKKKDPWEGVEFVQEKDTLKIYKVNHFHNSQVLVFSDVEWIWKDNCKPSTESSYVEQLKKEAFERFGEIKEGDRFELSNGIPNKYVIGYFFKPVWNYCKESDKLSFSGYTLYEAGKWAERVKERVEVSFSGCHDEDYKSHLAFQSEFFVYNNRGFDPKTASIFLASQLEKYLNGEIE